MRYQTGIDSDCNRSIGIILANLGTPDAPDSPAVRKFLAQFLHCLLYTSDAADEEDSVDLGGRRII